MKNSALHKERLTYKTHRRQFIWQILVPLLIVLLIMLAGSGLTITASASQASLWADISLIWLLLPVIFFGLLALLLLGGMIYLMARLLQISPIYTAKAQDLVWRIQHIARQGMDGAVKPVIFLKSIAAGAKHIFQRN